MKHRCRNDTGFWGEVLGNCEEAFIAEHVVGLIVGDVLLVVIELLLGVGPIICTFEPLRQKCQTSQVA